MFAKLGSHKYKDALQRIYEQNKSIYGEQTANEKLYRKLQREDRLVKEHGSMESYSKLRQQKRSDAYDRAGKNRRKKANDEWNNKIIARYGSMENYINEKNKRDRELYERVDKIRNDPKLAKANRDFALTGSKYYKMQTGKGMDSIHCNNCTQRLGNSIDSCPICGNSSVEPIYGQMLKNPNDRRWLEPTFQNNKFRNLQFTGSGYTNQPSSAEYYLKERMKDAGNLDDLK